MRVGGIIARQKQRLLRNPDMAGIGPDGKDGDDRIEEGQQQAFVEGFGGPARPLGFQMQQARDPGCVFAPGIAEEFVDLPQCGLEPPVVDFRRLAAFRERPAEGVVSLAILRIAPRCRAAEDAMVMPKESSRHDREDDEESPKRQRQAFRRDELVKKKNKNATDNAADDASGDHLREFVFFCHGAVPSPPGRNGDARCNPQAMRQALSIPWPVAAAAIPFCASLEGTRKTARDDVPGAGRAIDRLGKRKPPCGGFLPARRGG